MYWFSLSKWHFRLGILCDKRMESFQLEFGLNGNLYRTIARSTTLLDMECGAVYKKIEQRMSVTEMRMLRWTSRKLVYTFGVTKKNRIRSEYTCDTSFQ